MSLYLEQALPNSAIPNFASAIYCQYFDKTQSATHGKHKPSDRCSNQEFIKLKRKDFMSYSLNMSE